jgi:hypothetical protein
VEDIAFQSVHIDSRTWWVSRTPFELRWKGVADLVAEEGAEAFSSKTHGGGAAADIMSHLNADVGVRDAATARDAAIRFVREGFESWDDVTRLSTYLGGNPSQETVAKYLRDSLGLPTAVAGKVASNIAKNDFDF